MNIELITWRDAGSGNPDRDFTWASASEVDSDDNPIIRSVGFLVKETDNNVTIAMDLSDDNQTHTRSRIPKGMIISRQILIEGRLCVN